MEIHSSEGNGDREKGTATVIEGTYRIVGKLGGFKIWQICRKMYLAVFKFGRLLHRTMTQSLV